MSLRVDVVDPSTSLAGILKQVVGHRASSLEITEAKCRLFIERTAKELPALAAEEMQSLKEFISFQFPHFGVFQIRYLPTRNEAGSLIDVKALWTPTQVRLCFSYPPQPAKRTQQEQALIERGASLTSGLIIIAGRPGTGRTQTAADIVLQTNNRASIIASTEAARYPSIGMRITTSQASGQTASQVLRQALRADPDILVCDEIADECAGNLLLDAVAYGALAIAVVRGNDPIRAFCKVAKITPEALQTYKPLTIQCNLIDDPTLECNDIRLKNPKEFEPLFQDFIFQKLGEFKYTAGEIQSGEKLIGKFRFERTKLKLALATKYPYPKIRANPLDKLLIQKEKPTPPPTPEWPTPKPEELEIHQARIKQFEDIITTLETLGADNVADTLRKTLGYKNSVSYPLNYDL